MRRFCALLLGLAVLTVTPGVASADPFNTRPARNQQAVDYVIARALAQRGVPFAYGGGDANGPTRGVVRETPAAAEPAAAAIPGGVPGLNFPGLAPPPLSPRRSFRAFRQHLIRPPMWSDSTPRASSSTPSPVSG